MSGRMGGGYLYESSTGGGEGSGSVGGWAGGIGRSWEGGGGVYLHGYQAIRHFLRTSIFTF